MSDAELYMINIQDEADRYLYHIEEALGSEDTDETLRHVRESIPVGQALMDSLEDLLNTTEDSDTADHTEEAIHYLVTAMEQGDTALESTEDEIEDTLSEARRCAERVSVIVSRLA